jgi:hypothetical protein
MSIPASNIVTVNPGVIDSGGTGLALNGLILSSNAYIPTGTVQSFVSADAVKDFFGPASAEYAIAPNYFLGFDNSTTKPGMLYFAPYVGTDRAAWLQSGSLASMTLTQLKALSGVLTVTVDGVVKTSSTITLSGATSFSNAATLITSGFSGGVTCTWDSIKSVFFLTSATTGALSTITFATGTLSAGLKFTSATGAILSQGDVADTPATAMDAAKSKTQNWATFTTMWEPLIADKEAFAAWTNSQNQRFLYVCWDTDVQATVNGSTTCFGVVSKTAEYDAVLCVYNTLALAVMALGTAASIDFNRRNGRITFAFKTQSGFPATVTDETISANLLANGYSYYGTYATANDSFTFFYDGKISGKWLFADTYVDQIYINSQFQLALMELLTNIKSIPYNDAGYALIRAAMLDPIAQGLNSGIIRTGIALSSAQAAEINSAAGLDVSSDIEKQGYYLQILDPGAQVRGNRGTPVINFWYTDGGAVHKISLASIDII